MNIDRPQPDRARVEGLELWFSPSLELEIWAHAAFIADDGALHNPDHSHLVDARVCFLWTNLAQQRKGRDVIGTAELGTPNAMGKWAKAKAELQLTEWFGEVPDFLITIDARWWLDAPDVACCALVEHELYHCAQDRDEFGGPKFKKTGGPAFTIQGHECEEFAGVVRRYGVVSAGVRAIVDAAAQQPLVSAQEIILGCGNCR